MVHLRPTGVSPIECRFYDAGPATRSKTEENALARRRRRERYSTHRHWKVVYLHTCARAEEFARAFSRAQKQNDDDGGDNTHICLYFHFIALTDRRRTPRARPDGLLMSYDRNNTKHKTGTVMVVGRVL